MESIEQQIYASLALPGLKPGHHTHAHTDGLDAAALEQHERICNQWGEYEPGADFTRALVQMPLWNGGPPPAPPTHYAIVYITYQGRDAGGRPGALLRHVVRLPADVYASLDYNPFHLQRHVKLLAEWTPDIPFPAIDFPSDPTTAEDLKGIFPERHGMLRGLLTRLLADGEVHLPVASDSPAAEELFAELMEVVPVARRQWLSLATFAYKNAANFAVAAMRQEEASLRRSLEAVQEPRLSQLAPAAAGYVTDVFGALEARNWGQAASLVRRSEVGALSAEVLATSPAAHEIGGRASGAPGSPPPAGGPLPFQVRGGPPPPAPPLPTASARRRRSRTPALLGLLAIALAVVVAVVLLRRGGDEGPVGRRSSEQIRRASAASVAALVEEHERILADMLAQGARDFDLTEAMASAVETLPERAQAAVAAEAPGVEEALKGAAAAKGEAGLLALAARMDKLAGDATTNASHLQGLRELLQARSPEKLRAVYDAQQQVVHAPAGTGEPDEPVLASVFMRARALGASAKALQQLATLAPSAGEAEWQAAARALQQAADAFPEEWPAPSTVTLLATGTGALGELLSAEQRAGLSALALAVPYRGGALQQGDLATRATGLATAVTQWTQAGLPQPARMAAAAGFYAAAGEIAPGLRGSAASAQAALTRATALCADANALSPCAVPEYGAHVARWKLEAWRALGGPTGGQGRALFDQLGAASLPGGDAAALTNALALLGQIESAPTPAPPALAAGVEAARAGFGESFYGQLFADWLSRNKRQAQTQQSGFKEAYSKLQAAVAALRSSNEGDAPGALHAMAQAVQRLQGLDLAQAEAVAGERARVQAARATIAAWEHPAPLRVERIELQLLTEADYSGARQPVARPRVTVSRIVQGAATEVLSVMPPPMLAAPGTGFAPAKIPVGQPLRIGPSDRLLVMGKDDGKSAPWFHVYADPPREGHVATLLAAGLHARIAPAQAAQIAAAGAQLPPAVGEGPEVASIRFVLASGWWQELAAALPALP